MAQKQNKRGACPKRSSTPVSVPIPKDWKTPIQQAVARLDLDRSKFTRLAIKEKCERMGITLPELAA